MEINISVLKQIIGDKECQIVLLREEIQRLHGVIAAANNEEKPEIAPMASKS